MKYECKQCKTEFTKDWGQARCPKCGSKDLWTTGGEVKAIFTILLVCAVLLLVLFLISYVALLGGVIAALFTLPIAVWSILKRRKKNI